MALGPGKEKIIECFRPKSGDSLILEIKSKCKLSFHSGYNVSKNDKSERFQVSYTGLAH